MSRPSALLAAALAALLCLAPAARAELSLVWSDEFDGASLNTADWSYDTGDGCPSLCGWGNNELEYYRTQNVSVSGGNLVIEARQEYYGGRQFTSGKIHTRDKRSFLYGRIEMRARIPSGDGLWPAFWMMPQDGAYGGWASSGELDIMESVNAADTIHGTIHYGGVWPDNVHSGGTWAPGTDFGADFHVYAVEWEPDRIRWYVDDVNYATRYSTQWYSDGDPGNDLAPFDQPFYIILNFAVGGNFPGCTETGCITGDLPQQYLVDYVRVYQDIGNVHPTCEITAPAGGVEPPAGDILLAATAADVDGAIDRVEFYDGDTLLGEDTSAPYEFIWTAVPDGCFQVTARAWDDQGGWGDDVLDLTVGDGCGQAPYLGAPPSLPARFQAEDYDVGGEGVGYHDADTANQGGQYRTGEGVDIESCSDVGGGYDVGWVQPGEWIEYTVDVPSAGAYPLDARVASLSAGGTFRLEVGGEDASGDVAFGATGGWQTWTTVAATAQLPSGRQVLRLVIVAGEFNVNWLEFGAGETGVDIGLLPARPTLHPCFPNPFNPSTTVAFSLPARERVDLAVHDLAGRRVRTLVDGTVAAGRHEIVWDGCDAAGRVAAAGVYVVRLEAAGMVELRRAVLLK